MHFFQDSVEYLGHIVSKEGISNSPHKVSAIADVPSPTDASKLSSFLGMVNHYGKFIKNLTDPCDPLNKLLRKSITWNWTDQCQQTFTKIKEALISADVLAHFDPSLSLGITCDANIVAALFHSYPDGSEHPIANASKSLSNTVLKLNEKPLVSYSVLESSISFSTEEHLPCSLITNCY